MSPRVRFIGPQKAALWLKEGPPDLLSPWPQFTILARELAKDRPAREIPLMEQIALTTVMVLGD